MLLPVFGFTVVVGRLVVVDLAVCLLSFGFEVAAVALTVLLAARNGHGAAVVFAATAVVVRLAGVVFGLGLAVVVVFLIAAAAVFVDGRWVVVIEAVLDLPADFVVTVAGRLVVVFCDTAGVGDEALPVFLLAEAAVEGRRVVVDTLASLFFTAVAPVFTLGVVALGVPFGLGVVATVFFWAVVVTAAEGRFVVVVVCCFLMVVGLRVVVTTGFLVVF